MKNVLLVSILLLTLVLAPTILAMDSSFVDAKSKNSKAKADFIKKAGRAVEGNWTSIKIANLLKFNTKSFITFYNKTAPSPGPVTPPSPPPNPTPTPSNSSVTSICFAGDLQGLAVPNAMTEKLCDFKIGLGDLGYQKDLSYFKGLKFNKCVIGNHDADEESKGQPIVTEALAYCGDHWSSKVANGTTLLIGFNTNGKDSETLSFATGLVSSPSIMAGVKNVVLISHKSGHVFPSAHHPAEASSIYASLEKIFPNAYEIGAHNHDSASAANGKWFIAGTGGRSFYACGTGNGWDYCQNQVTAFLQLSINNANGQITPHFIDSKQNVIH